MDIMKNQNWKMEKTLFLFDSTHTKEEKKIFAVLYPDLHTSESFQAIGSLRNLQVSRFAYSFLTSRSVNLKSRQGLKYIA